MDSAIAPDRHSASAERVLDASSVLVAKVSWAVPRPLARHRSHDQSSDSGPIGAGPRRLVKVSGQFSDRASHRHVIMMRASIQVPNQVQDPTRTLGSLGVNFFWVYPSIQDPFKRNLSVAIRIVGYFRGPQSDSRQ